MFREGQSVALDDLIGAVDVLYQSIGATESCGAYVREWIADGANGGSASSRALNLLLKDLGAFRDGGDGDLSDPRATLDPIQALLLVRVLTEEIGVPLRRAIAQAPRDGIWRPGAPPPPAEDVIGWAEDAFVGGVTGLYGAASEVSATLKEKLGNQAERMGKANAIASIAKFIATYTMLRGGAEVDDPGQPLVRTKDTSPGTQRTLVAWFYIDGSRVTDWMKDNRQLVALAGLDLDMPKSGALKGIETDWDIKQSHSSTKTHLIQLVRGSPDISKVKTDENGEARITVEGTPQRRKLDPKSLMPDDRQVVKIVITPQVKSTEMQQDLVDAVTGAIGIKDGLGVGWLTPVIETLYRLKWKGGRVLELRIQDWVDAETYGQLDVSITARGSRFTPTSSLQQTIDRQLTLTKAVMDVYGFELPEMPDSEEMKYLPPEVRRQMEEGLRQMAEAAKQRSFIMSAPGVVAMRINDRSAWFSAGSETTGCEVDRPGSGSTSVIGARDETITRTLIEDGSHLFQVEVDHESRTARLTWAASVEVVVLNKGRTSGSAPYSDESKVKMGIFGDLELEPPFDREIVIPLKETDIRGNSAKNYYGLVNVPFRFGTGGVFSGTAVVSYSVTRKVDKGGG